ncbi:MAG: sigma-54 dependent transcriptional regulator [Motiliproteus sp.]
MPRPLVCLDMTGEGRIPGDLFMSSGWNPFKTNTIEQTASHIKSETPHVGLVIIGESECNGQLHSLEQLLGHNQSIEWVGLVDPAFINRAQTQRLIVSYLHDYHTLPCDKDRLFNSLGHAYGMAQSRRAYLEKIAKPVNGYQMVAVSPAMSALFKDIDKIASVNASVMVGGESGTGKELVARAIHNESRRTKGPFIAINCGAIPDGLIQSELFGHEKGAFSGAHQRHIGSIESAHTGTIFLDEIGDLPIEQQANLLRVLQEKKITRVGSSKPINIDIRVITATHRNLEDAIAEGAFREDLYYRLHVLSLVIPPLRDRREDIAPLCHYFLKQFHSESTHKIKGFSADALRHMHGYHWPGNVRELINRVERAVVMCDQELIEAKDLEFDPGTASQSILTLSEARAVAERDCIKLAMICADQSVSNAAKILGVSRVTLYRLIDKLAFAEQ